MHVTVEPKYKASILKIQRPVIRGPVKNAVLLIYTKDGKIPPKLVPDAGELSVALGNRIKAHYACTVDGTNITLGNEVYCQD